MKTLIIILATLMYQNECVNGTFIDYFFMQIKQIKRAITDSFQDIREVIRNFLDDDAKPRITRQEPKAKHIVKKSYKDFVEKTAAESEMEYPEYLNYKSEPTAVMSTTELAALHGKHVESHVIVTTDGYLLTLHRIASNANNATGNNQTIILHHGLLGSSADWILLGPEKSLPYLLTNAGYDVWMVNARGSYYSRNHVTYKVETKKFWNFSWQEMGEYDLPAVIDYIRSKTSKANRINFIGHSMGATAYLVLLSSKPLYNDYINMAILLAPIAFMTHIKGPFKSLSNISSGSQRLLKLLDTGEFLPSKKIPEKWMTDYCHGSVIYCRNPLYFFTGGIPLTKVIGNSSLLYHVPSGASTNTILHYAQVTENGEFHRFNNINSKFPLDHVTVPTVLISSSGDWLASIPDVFKLYFSIANPFDHYVIRNKKFTHTDFVWGTEAYDLVFVKVMDYLEGDIKWDLIKANEIE